MTFTLTVFPADNVPMGKRIALTWAEFCAYVRAEPPLPRNVPKKQLQLWCLAEFKDDHRSRANVEAVHALGFDVDVDPIPSEADLRAALDGQAAFFHCSSSSTRTAPRWRLWLPLSRPVTADEYDRLHAAARGALPFPVGQAKDPSRGWYAPREPAEGEFVAVELAGDPLDVDAVLAAAPPEAPAPPPTPAPARSCGATARRRAMAMALASAWPPDGKRREAHMSLAGALRNEGFTESEAVDFLVELYGGLGEDKRSAAEGVCRSTYSKPEGSALTGWTRLKSFVDPIIVDAARGALSRDAAWKEADARRLAEIERRNAARHELANDGTSGGAVDARSFVVVPAADLATPVPPVPYVVRHFGITRGRPTLLAGYGGSGKTIVVQCLALHMAAGLNRCWGLPVASGAVLHLDYEMTLDPIKRRYQRLAYAYGLKLEGCALEVVSMPDIYLSDQDAEQALARVCQGKLLVIVDNLAAATATAIARENEQAIRKYLDVLTRVSAKTGCTFVVLVHERKAGKDEPGGLQRVRGSSAITDAAGSVVSISAAEGDGVITASQTKTSHRRPGEDLTLKIEDVDYPLGELPPGLPSEDDDPPGLRVVSLGERPVSEESRTVQAKILAELAKGPIENKHLLHRAIGKKNGTANAEIDALVVRREIVFIKGRGYELDSPARRAERVARAVRDHRQTRAQLAKAACVDDDVLTELQTAGRLYRSGSGFVSLHSDLPASPSRVL